MHLTEEEQEFWNVLSHEYPSLKTCQNCKNAKNNNPLAALCWDCLPFNFLYRNWKWKHAP